MPHRESCIFFPKGATVGTTVAGATTSGSAANRLNRPSAVFVDSAGVIYIADTLNYRVQKWPVGSVFGHTVAQGLGTTYGLFVDQQSNVYVSECSANRVRKWTAGNTTANTLVCTGEHNAVKPFQADHQPDQSKSFIRGGVSLTE